jgi:formate dehydrogenase maturation protein FdhE
MADETLDEFKEETKNEHVVRNWDFNEFGIECKFCNSKNISVSGRMWKEHMGYCSTCYSEWTEGEVMIKCNSCGRVMKLKLENQFVLFLCH